MDTTQPVLQGSKWEVDCVEGHDEDKDQLIQKHFKASTHNIVEKSS